MLISSLDIIVLTPCQGKRAHWSADNTAMHVVRSRKGVVFIDELDLVGVHIRICWR